MIPMQRQATVWTEMQTLGESFVYPLPAIGTELACQPRIHRDHLLPSLFRFGSKDAQELSPACIGDRL